MDYFTMAKEYYRDAEQIKQTLKKYEAKLHGCRKENLEKLNSAIASYRYIYYDLLNTAKMLEQRGDKLRKENYYAA